MPTRTIDGLTELKTLVGQEVGVSDWFEMSQARIDAFAEVTRDRQWLHVDTVRAKTESPYRTTIAHGYFTLSLLSHLHGQAVQFRGGIKMAINYGLNRVRFPAPVLSGSRIRSHGTLQSVEDIEGGVQVVWSITVEIEGSAKPGLVAECVGRIYV
jgi:acyl dehydratase